MKGKKTIALILILIFAALFPTSCKSKTVLIDLDYFDGEYKTLNNRYFPADMRSLLYGNSIIYTVATAIDPNLPDDTHYVQPLLNNINMEKHFESHRYFLQQCSQALETLPNGYRYHSVRYLCGACNYAKNIYVYCERQDENCDGSCINYGKDIELEGKLEI